MRSKRIIALLLTVVLALGMAASPAFAAAEVSAFGAQQLGQEEDFSTNALVSIRISASGDMVYGSPMELIITPKPEDTQYVAVILGTSGEAKGYVALILPEKVRILLELIPLPSSMAADESKKDSFNLYEYIKQLIDGNDVNVLLRVADEVAAVMESLQYYVPTLDSIASSMRQVLRLIRLYLPNGMLTRIYLDEQPTDSGKYLAGAVTLERGNLNTAGLARFSIARKSAGVRMYWSSDMPETLTVEQAKSFDFSAVTEDNGTIVQGSTVSYLYENKKGTEKYSSTEPPTEPGEYSQTAVLGGNYKADNISRTIKIVA